MKKFFRALDVLALCSLVGAPMWEAQAQTYPVNNPTYIPTATGPSCTTTGTGAQTCVMSTQGLGSVAIRMSGTNGGFAATIKGSNDLGSNFTTLTAFPVAGGAAVTSQVSNGFWLVSAVGMNQVEVAFSSVASGAVVVAMSGSPAELSAGAVNASGSVQLVAGTNIVGKVTTDQTTPGTTDLVHTQQLATLGDPCQNPSILKSSVAVAQSSSATTKIVDTSGSTVIYVCHFAASFNGTNPTGTLKTGTHGSADCDTAAASLTGAIAPSATIGEVALGDGAGMVVKSIAGGQICLTTAATTSVQGVLTYVQQ